MNLFPSKKLLKCHTVQESWTITLAISFVWDGGQAWSLMKHGFGISNVVWESGQVITPSMCLCMETSSATRMQEYVLRETERDTENCMFGRLSRAVWGTELSSGSCLMWSLWGWTTVVVPAAPHHWKVKKVNANYEKSVQLFVNTKSLGNWSLTAQEWNFSYFLKIKE